MFRANFQILFPTVQTRPSFSCKHAGELIATASDRPDFLANIISEVDGFGSPRCPWIIAAPRGQKINISLVDFGMTSLSAPPPTSSSAEYEPESPRNICLIYAKIREQGSAYHDVRVCDQDIVAREKQVYVFDSTRVQVALMNLVDTGNDPIYFLLKYEGKTGLRYMPACES